MLSRIDLPPVCAVRFGSFHRLVWVCEVEISHMGKTTEIIIWCVINRELYMSALLVADIEDLT